MSAQHDVHLIRKLPNKTKRARNFPEKNELDSGKKPNDKTFSYLLLTYFIKMK